MSSVFLRGESSVEKLQILEEKIMKVVNKIKELTEENRALIETIKNLQGELKRKDAELEAMKQGMKNIDKLKADIERFNNERSTVRSQLEDLIKELESVEI